MRHESTPTHLGPEELHDSDLAVHAHLLDRPEALGCHHIDLQPCVLGYEQIEVLRRGEVTCGYTFIVRYSGLALSVKINDDDFN